MLLQVYGRISAEHIPSPLKIIIQWLAVVLAERIPSPLKIVIQWLASRLDNYTWTDTIDPHTLCQPPYDSQKLR